MSNAFDTIRREQLIGIIKKFPDEDEVRMIKQHVSKLKDKKRLEGLSVAL